MNAKKIAEEIRDFWAQEGYQEFPVSAVAVAIARAAAEQHDRDVEAVKKILPNFGPEGPPDELSEQFAIGVSDALGELKRANPRSLRIRLGE